MAINWHAVRETAKVEAICTFLEFNGWSVRRWSEDATKQSTSVRATVIVVCRDYLRLSRFQRELTKARESKTPLVCVWLESEEPKRNNVGDELFDELIYDNDQNSLLGMVLDKMCASTNHWEEDKQIENSTSDLVQVKRRRRKAAVVTLLVFMSLAIIGSLLGFSLLNKAGSKLRSEFCYTNKLFVNSISI